MQLFVKSASGRTIAVQASTQETVASLKSKAGICNGTLFFGGQCLSDEAMLADYGLQRESTIQVMVPVEGGKGKKKKKKVFTKPKKPTHRHKLEKMRALKYFKVTENDDGSYEVQRTRDECPNPSCGAGVFMAQHKDRKYCGKCYLTYAAK
ncbi:small subunit ribosomal protein S27Ae [Trypanosoma rangeli]|uniref:Ubiquitin-ribosomal protein eL40 fusion protein n=1 Tax=Trypanosoma rangeli TaxID=5698 RepID=A0A422P284_TRYRA|nr:small subunit ribosomal protein S27Ae [Trypanosoma rangeli]XP_029242391.1 small subunit ribosomal protein S27Ae [Trypanosoma rangeli]RNF04251.1 small subunit ribosomal protein S27Ae [Trypanosoma rangeli]RNF11827.1 small subunit ribosomal protein S27Ae [Trypanosoma rangeli]|eukprot:RNF04251.1 small subunit ribosomal protein S27Ae [Trypanosoma rangeli]